MVFVRFFTNMVIGALGALFIAASIEYGMQGALGDAIMILIAIGGGFSFAILVASGTVTWPMWWAGTGVAGAAGWYLGAHISLKLLDLVLPDLSSTGEGMVVLLCSVVGFVAVLILWEKLNDRM